MALAAFDTHKFVRKLKGAGFNEEQAEALTDAVRESHESADLATKADLQNGLEKLGLQLTVRFGIMLAAAITLAPIVFKYFLHLS